MSDQYLSKLYYDPARGFQSIENLYRKAKEDGKKYTKKQVKEWLEKQEVVQTHQQNKEHRQFPMYSEDIGAYQADLFFYSKYMGRFNDGYHAFMSVKNITTRKAYVIPMKNKKWESIRDAWKQFMSEATIPCTQLTTDKGSEWISKEFRQHSTEPHNIVHRTCETADHSRMGSIESFHRTLKMRLTKYMASYKTRRFIDELPKIIANYNDTVQERLKMSPNQIEANQTKQEDIRKAARIKTRDLSREIDFPIGTSVRLLKKKKMFGKEKAVWSDTIHKVTGGSTFNTSFQVDGKPKRWKHYELKKVSGEKVEQNPYKRKKAKDFDLEHHLENMPRTGSAPVPPPRKPVTKPKARVAKKSDPKLQAELKKGQAYTGKEFSDGGKRWKIVEVKVIRNKVFAVYHEVGNAKAKERTELSEVVANAEWSRASKGTTSKLSLERQIQKGSFVHVKNRGVNMTRRFVKLVNADSPFHFVARVKSIRGKEVSLTWYREDFKNQYVAKHGEWSESIRSVTLIDPSDVQLKKNGVMSLSGSVWKTLHVVGYKSKTKGN